MNEALPFIDAAMKYLIVPAVIWVWILHKQQGIHSTDIAVLRAEASARDQARREEREATAAQLEQIIGMLQTLNGRIDTMMSGNSK
jgi:Na+/H+ antiporter NhaA